MLHAAIDIHKNAFQVAVFDGESGEVVEERFSEALSVDDIAVARAPIGVPAALDDAVGLTGVSRTVRRRFAGTKRVHSCAHTTGFDRVSQRNC